MKRLIYICAPILTIITLLAACGTKASAEEVTAEDLEFLGEPFMEYGNIKVYIFIDNDQNGEDVISKDELGLIRYVNGAPRDSMLIVGPFNNVLPKGNMLQIASGPDTVNVDITKPFERYFDVRYVGILPECQTYRFSEHYSLNEYSFATDFQINIAIRDNDPDYIKDFIDKTIGDYVASYFDKEEDGKIVYPNIPLSNFKNVGFDQMSRYYYDWFCKLYKEEYGDPENNFYSDPDGPLMGPIYSSQFYIYPVWESSDSTLTTWRFYHFAYAGGAHGGQLEYFLTFDNKTGRILGVKDFFTNDQFTKATDILSDQLSAYHGLDLNEEERYSEVLDEETNVTAVKSNILNEVIDGQIYPRPAMTKKGIIFTYQTYEKGSNADGTLHFVQPYNPNHKQK
ncbi:MAG: hypothetical protein J1E63_03645 [Muribaculaceae bacterium]|nr:hypothetical protein [Muribaculaceae bacterium]